MLKHFVRRLWITAALMVFSAVVFAQQPGEIDTYQITPNVYACGNATTVGINCYGIPFNLNGTPAGSVWLYGNTNYSKYPPVKYGWGDFFAPAPMAGNEFTMDTWSFSPTAIVYHQGYPYNFTSFPCNNNCSTFSGTISGVTADGEPYVAQVSVGFWYFRSGRTVGAIITGGTLVVTYQ